MRWRKILTCSTLGLSIGVLFSFVLQEQAVRPGAVKCPRRGVCRGRRRFVSDDRLVSEGIRKDEAAVPYEGQRVHRRYERARVGTKEARTRRDSFRSAQRRHSANAGTRAEEPPRRPKGSARSSAPETSSVRQRGRSSPSTTVLNEASMCTSRRASRTACMNVRASLGSYL